MLTTLRALSLSDNARIGGIEELRSHGDCVIVATLTFAYFCCCPALVRRPRR
jgi:hypothetical protein